MSESIIPYTPEHESTEAHFFWDNVIRALETLSNYSDEVDLFADLESLRDEYEGDALDYIFSYYLDITTQAGESSDLKEVEAFLVEFGLIEEAGESE